MVVDNFEFIEQELNGLFVIQERIRQDERGYFLETYKKSDFWKAGLKSEFVQDNYSCSKRGVLRGLHFQKRYPQAKLVRVLHGQIYDVAVDLRPESETYGKWCGIYLSAENGKQIFIPKGFAHGFYVLSDQAEVAYKCDEYWHPEDEAGVIWNDPIINIYWPINGKPLLSEKDASFPCLKQHK